MVCYASDWLVIGDAGRLAAEFLKGPYARSYHSGCDTCVCSLWSPALICELLPSYNDDLNCVVT